MNIRNTFYLAMACLILFLAWYFSNIFFYIVISAVLSILGRPILRLLDGLHIGKFRIPHGVNSFLTLICLILIFSCLVLFFVPLFSSQANVISDINLDKVIAHFQDPITKFENFLMEYSFLEAGETISSALEAQIQSIVSLNTFSGVFKQVLSTTGALFVGTFAILFLTFFFLKEDGIIKRMLILVTPEEYEHNMHAVLRKTKKLLSNYFLGLLIEVGSMITILSITLWIFGIQNAFLIGFLGGLMNVIPYLGPVIGTFIGVFFVISTDLSFGLYNDIFDNSLIVVLTFATANLIDNIVLQPVIYSNSVKAHPIEIFLVIIMAGSIAGVGGMILAIPSYTIIRIFGSQFLSQFKLIKAWTENL